MYKIFEKNSEDQKSGKKFNISLGPIFDFIEFFKNVLDYRNSLTIAR